MEDQQTNRYIYNRQVMGSINIEGVLQLLDSNQTFVSLFFSLNFIFEFFLGNRSEGWRGSGLKVITALAEGLRSVPRVHIRWLIAAYDSNFNRSATFLPLRGTRIHTVHITPPRNTHISKDFKHKEI